MRSKQNDLSDILLHYNDNTESIILIDEHGKERSFEHIATIPYSTTNERRLYCLLKPLEKIVGIDDKQALIFLVDIDEEKNSYLRMEEDEKIAGQVFLKYYDLLERAGSKADFNALREDLEKRINP